MEKRRFEYAKKNKKKEYSEIIAQLGAIPHDTRDHLLIKYIAQCKLLHALCFFQWRYFKLRDSDPETAEHNKEIFKFRINVMARHAEWSASLRKQIAEESKLDRKSKERKKTKISEGMIELAK